MHIRHLNPLTIHPERITKGDRNMVNDFDYEGMKSKEDFSKTEKKNNICTDVFYCKKNLISASSRRFANFMDLLLITKKGR